MTALSMFDVSIPIYRQILGALGGVLAKGAAYCAEKGMDEAVLTNARLYENMFPFNVQVGQAIWHSAGAVRRLRGEQMPPFTAQAPEARFAALSAAIDDAMAYLNNVTPSDMAGVENADIVLAFPNRAMPFTGAGYLLSFAMPNFYFHTTTAYDILRHNGVALGKRDFMGMPQVKAA